MPTVTCVFVFIRFKLTNHAVELFLVSSLCISSSVQSLGATPCPSVILPVLLPVTTIFREVAAIHSNS